MFITIFVVRPIYKTEVKKIMYVKKIMFKICTPSMVTMLYLIRGKGAIVLHSGGKSFYIYLSQCEINEFKYFR
jgi:hypothetical protein